MKILNSMIAYTTPHLPADIPGLGPSRFHLTAGKIEVGPWPDKTGWSRPYMTSVGACFMARHEFDHWQNVALMFADFHAAVVRDGIDPQRAHQAFLAIDEYRQVISPDIEGADDEE